jgi:hypothetical protein
MGMPELEIYSMIGAEGFARLVRAFYRQVPQDDLLEPIYPASDLPRGYPFLVGMDAICDGGCFEEVGAHDLAVANLGGDGVLSGAKDGLQNEVA